MAKKKHTAKQETKRIEDLARSLTRRGPGGDEYAPTPERVVKAHAVNGRTAVRAHVIHDDAGFPTPEHYWQLTPVLDTLEKRGTLTHEEWDTACRYMRHYAGSRHKGPATAKYLPSYDTGYRDMEPAERAMAMGQARAKAEAAVHPIMRPCLRWLEAAAEDELPLWRLGQMFSPDAPQATQSARAPAILHVTLSMLAAHYGCNARFTVSEVDTAIRTFRMTRTTVEIEERVTG